jgi:cytochrome c biogenesis protein CcmG/thiol:disulfide interchange protein DsbE
MSIIRRRLLRIGACSALALSASAAWVLYDRPAIEPEPIVSGPDPDRPMRLPDLTLSGLPGREGVEIADIAQQARPVLLNIFASWCAPCLIEAPLLTALRRQGFLIWGIAYRDRPETITAFLNRYGDPYARLGLDPAGDIVSRLGVSGVPENILVDGTGTARWRWASGLTQDVIEQTLLPRWKSLA